jgi:hypothetical protein
MGVIIMIKKKDYTKEVIWVLVASQVILYAAFIFLIKVSLKGII